MQATQFFKDAITRLEAECPEVHAAVMERGTAGLSALAELLAVGVAASKALAGEPVNADEIMGSILR